MAQGNIYTKVQSAEVNIPQKSHKEAIDRPTVLYVLCCMVSVQQTSPLPENATLKDGMFALSLYRMYRTTSQCLSDSTIAVLYFIHSAYVSTHHFIT